jgi:hypothetical protein
MPPVFASVLELSSTIVKSTTTDPSYTLTILMFAGLIPRDAATLSMNLVVPPLEKNPEKVQFILTEA